MPTQKPSHDNLEIRSEKVRKILGEVPHRLIKWGFIIIGIILAAIICVVLFVDYPYGEGESILQHLF